MRAGHEVKVWSRPAEKAETLAHETGCIEAEKPAALAAGSEAMQPEE